MKLLSLITLTKITLFLGIFVILDKSLFSMRTEIVSAKFIGILVHDS